MQCVSDTDLTKLVSAFDNKIENPPNGSLSCQSFFIQMNYPVCVSQNIYVFLQAVLQGSGLEQCSTLGPITRWNNHLKTITIKTFQNKFLPKWNKQQNIEISAFRYSTFLAFSKKVIYLHVMLVPKNSTQGWP